MIYRILADVIVGVHVAYVAFVVFGQLTIWLGVLLRWGFVRNPWFRWIHLAMMSVVGLEAALGLTCPLTEWEAWLRTLGGEDVDGDSFLGRLLHNLIFVDLPSPVIVTLHITFAILVIATFVLAPPRGIGRRRPARPPSTLPASAADSPGN
jgi:Protein of Unknown function (DUF2784)